jgi:L,D-transpeptidase ErfK/SrfK
MTPRQSPTRSLVRPALPVLAALALAACSLNGPRVQAPPPVEVAAPVPEVPKAQPPVATHRFEIDPAVDEVIGELQVTVTGPDDTLPDIARRFNVGYEEIVRANPGLDPWLPGAGREVLVPSRFVLPHGPREGLVVNLAALRVFYFPPKLANGKRVPRKPGELQTVYTYPIGIGRVGWSTPLGSTRALGKQKDPVWRPTASIRKEHRENGEELPAVVPAGPDNPLGRYKITLGWPSYLIHGTNKPYGVGLRSSHGCIRLYPEDIEQLFGLMPVGTPVHVVNQPVVYGRRGEQLYVQFLPHLEDDRQVAKDPLKRLQRAVQAPLQQWLKASQRQLDAAGLLPRVADARGLPLPVFEPATDVGALLAAAPRVENRIPDGANWNGADDPSRQSDRL